ncbi:MAG: IS607 family transposase [Truepera sp.]|nr:IS607 family transposase [Truepera sp.]
MKLSVWAKQQGIAYKTAWRMWKLGQLPIPAEQLPTGTIIVHPPAAITGAGAILYARVASADQKADLDRQVARLSEFAAANKLHVVAVVKEVGSGLNGRRRAMLKLLRDPSIAVIVVEHRDRLMRFGLEYLEAALQAQGRKLMVVNPEELKDDVVRDLHEVIVSLCARLYGRRSAKNRAKRAMDVVLNEA